MTPAGATYPYGKDPLDSNIRIAPSLPPVEELKQAMDVFCTCIKLAALEKLLRENSETEYTAIEEVRKTWLDKEQA